MVVGEHITVGASVFTLFILQAEREKMELEQAKHLAKDMTEIVEVTCSLVEAHTAVCSC